jgi:hypothetical protein
MYYYSAVFSRDSTSRDIESDTCGTVGQGIAADYSSTQSTVMFSVREIKKLAEMSYYMKWRILAEWTLDDRLVVLPCDDCLL